MEEIEMIIDMSKEQMDKSIQRLEKNLLKIRAGRANPSMLDSIRVDYYGSSTPLSQVSNINTPDARTLSVQPWEKGLIQEIEKSIINSGLGLNPQNNGDVVIINIPPLTEERRKGLVKDARAEGEESKISIRSARKDANDEIKALDGISEDFIKDAEARVQTMTDTYSKKVDTVIDKKEVDILMV
mgnify:FL=1